MMEFHDSLAKFASSLRNFEKKAQEVLDAAPGRVNASAPAVEGGSALPEARRRRRSRKRHGRGLDDDGAAAYRSDDNRSFNTLTYVTAGTEDLVQKRDDESLRVLRIKILHHGHEEHDSARRPHSKTTPCAMALLASAVWGRTSVTRSRKSTIARVRSMKDKTAKPTRASTSIKTSTAPSTTAPVKYCAQNYDDVKVAQDNVEVQDSEHHHEESSGEDVGEQTASQSGGDDESAQQVDAQSPSENDVHEYEPAAGSEGTAGAEDVGSAEDGQSSTVKTSQVTKGRGAKPYNLRSRGDHLRIHIVHKPSNPQADVNETFFANHSLVNKTDVLVVKANDHLFVTNGSKAVKTREVDRGHYPGEVLTYVEVRNDDDQEPYFGNQDYVEEFEKRVKQVNESLQRIRNYRQPQKAKRRSRRDNVRFMRSLRFASPKKADTASRKGDIPRSRVVGAHSGSIRITINRRLDNEEGAQIANADRVAPIRNAESRGDGGPSRHKIHVLGPQAREVPLIRTVVKRGASESSSTDGSSGGDLLEMLVNNSRGKSEPLMNLPGKMAAPVAYALGSRPVVPKYEQLRFRGITLTCVLAAVSVFTVAVVLTMLYFNLNHLFRFKRGFKYTSLDLTVSPYDDR
ncbi:hypothetical protein V5799_006975 [Amblyomma americanum]|uniref:Uncharacterized protein n=1 Tax=Amblyomma americanum TaxID=6943 RepID=A0AAQ4DUV5_AMBAM